jgi:hypothetical protein
MTTKVCPMIYKTSNTWRTWLCEIYSILRDKSSDKLKKYLCDKSMTMKVKWQIGILEGNKRNILITTKVCPKIYKTCNTWRTWLCVIYLILKHESSDKLTKIFYVTNQWPWNLSDRLGYSKAIKEIFWSLQRYVQWFTRPVIHGERDCVKFTQF